MYNLCALMSMCICAFMLAYVWLYEFACTFVILPFVFIYRPAGRNTSKNQRKHHLSCVKSCHVFSCCTLLPLLAPQYCAQA